MKTPAGRSGGLAAGDGFQLLLAALSDDPVAAGERFQALHAKLTAYFHYGRCLDSEHWADETLDRVATRLMEGAVVDSIYAFTYGVARLVLLEARREAQRARELPRQRIGPAQFATEISFRCLDRCLSALSVSKRGVIERYYASSGKALIDDRRKMASELGVTLEVLRTRALRIRKELENCILACQEKEASSVISEQLLSLSREEDKR